MQNYEQILQELGIEVPEDKKADLKKKIGENYRTVSDYNKVAEKMDSYKTSLEDVQARLDAFKDVDVEDLRSQISTLTTQLADEKAERKKDAERAEMESNISEFLGGKKFVNTLTEKAIRASLAEELGKDTAKGKSIEDIFNALISDKDGKQLENILVDESEQRAKQNAAKFTTSTGKRKTPGGMTKEDFRAMSLDERIQLKQTDPELYENLKK